MMHLKGCICQFSTTFWHYKFRFCYSHFDLIQILIQISYFCAKNSSNWLKFVQFYIFAVIIQCVLVYRGVKLPKYTYNALLPPLYYHITLNVHYCPLCVRVKHSSIVVIYTVKIRDYNTMNSNIMDLVNHVYLCDSVYMCVFFVNSNVAGDLFTGHLQNQ